MGKQMSNRKAVEERESRWGTGKRMSNRKVAGYRESRWGQEIRAALRFW